MRANIKIINLSIFFSFFIVGITITIASPILIEISEAVNRPLIIASLIFTAFIIGYGTGPHIGNLLIKVFGRKSIIGASFFIQSLSLLLFPFFKNFFAAFFIFFIMGLCVGFFYMILSVILVEIHSEREGFFLIISIN